MARKRRRLSERLAFWSGKIIKRWSRNGRPAVGFWASRLLYELDRRSDRQAVAQNMASLAEAVNIPRKFLSRAIAATNGLVSFLPGPTIQLKLHRKRLLRGKNAVEKIRGHIPRSLRSLLLEQDGHICGRCGEKFRPHQLEIDHVIPLALRGADEPGNWVTVCQRDHREKRANLQYDFIRYYRQHRVDRFGIRFRDGRFWPQVNGRTRMDRRSDLKASIREVD